TRYYSSSKRTAATAGLGRVRVIEDEAAAVEAVGEVQLCTRKIEERFWIDENANAIDVEHLVILSSFAIEAQRIGKPGTSATLDADAQAVRLRDLVRFHDLPYLAGGLVGQRDLAIEIGERLFDGRLFERRHCH